MNPRIIELSKQVFSFQYKTNPNVLNPGHHIDHIHKFAELIVIETINEFTEQLQKHGIDHSNNPKYYSAIVKTKEYFRVE
jgi:hypothetical protein